MKERKKLVTDETIINIDEDIFKLKAEELMCELFVDYVNNLHDSAVIEINI